MIRRALAFGTCAALFLSAAPATGQTMRNYTASRPLTAHPPPLRAALDFGSGRVVVRAGDANELYAMRLEYDAERFAPIQRFDVRTGILQLGARPIGSAGLRVTSREHLRQAARFEFAPGVPLSLEANLGASESHLDMAGLALQDLTIRAGASRSTVTASAPTTGRCERARFLSGASELDLTGLANLRCRQIEVDGGAGRTLMNFGGTWSVDIHLEATQTAGALTLQIPRGTGVRLQATGRFLSRLTFDGLVRSGEGWQSANFATAPHHLTINLTTNVADVTLEWIER